MWLFTILHHRLLHWCVYKNIMVTVARAKCMGPFSEYLVPANNVTSPTARKVQRKSWSVGIDSVKRGRITVYSGRTGFLWGYLQWMCCARIMKPKDWEKRLPVFCTGPFFLCDVAMITCNFWIHATYWNTQIYCSGKFKNVETKSGIENNSH